MGYLFFQMGLWLLLAFVLGLFIGGLLCWFCCRAKQRDNDELRRQLAAYAASPPVQRVTSTQQKVVEDKAQETVEEPPAQINNVADLVDSESSGQSFDEQDPNDDVAQVVEAAKYSDDLESSDLASTETIDQVAPGDEALKPEDSPTVTFFSEAPAQVDDLKRIKGVGPVLEKTLNQLGIYQFAQIAAFTDKDIAEVNASLRFSGRIERENWVQQAKTLSAGEVTDFAKRVDKGDVEY